MTLRLRLVIALVALALCGLTAFGLVTYNLYARSQYVRLDEQLSDARRPMIDLLLREAGRSNRRWSLPDRRGGGPGVPPANPAFLSAFGQLWDAGSGEVEAVVEPQATDARPDLSASSIAPGDRSFVVGAAEGEGDWLAVATAFNDGDDHVAVVAVPLADTTAALNQLVLIEATAAAGLLALLAAGSWLILRRGLQPLEHMAASSRAIAAGDLSRRVAPAEGHTEVGQLGLALNTMLDGIEAAFHEREATERRLRQFLADASHELRTPLTSIQGFAELFRLEHTPDRVSLEVILRRIEEESARMKHLVEDLLLLARLDETRPFAPGPVDLAVLAADACSDAVATAPDRAVTLDAPEPVVVLADQDHLRQAIANLMTNALRHTPPGSPIEVSAHIGQGAASVEVRDHGPGLDPEALAHVFDRFWQADGARSGTGAGLGLAIVAGIAAEHRGTVSAANAPDGGAVFILHLPLTSAAPAPDAGPPWSARFPGGSEDHRRVSPNPPPSMRS